jgi:hypothetical protein
MLGWGLGTSRRILIYEFNQVQSRSSMLVMVGDQKIRDIGMGRGFL